MPLHQNSTIFNQIISITSISEHEIETQCKVKLLSKMNVTLFCYISTWSSKELHTYFIICHHYMGKYLVKKSQNADKATKYLAGKKKAVQASLLSCTAEENVPRNFCFGGRGKERGYAWCINVVISDDGFPDCLGCFCSLCAGGSADLSAPPRHIWDGTLQRLIWPNAPNSHHCYTEVQISQTPLTPSWSCFQNFTSSLKSVMPNLPKQNSFHVRFTFVFRLPHSKPWLLPWSTFSSAAPGIQWSHKNHKKDHTFQLIFEWLLLILFSLVFSIQLESESASLWPVKLMSSYKIPYNV